MVVTPAVAAKGYRGRVHLSWAHTPAQSSARPRPSTVSELRQVSVFIEFFGCLWYIQGQRYCRGSRLTGGHLLCLLVGRPVPRVGPGGEIRRLASSLVPPFGVLRSGGDTCIGRNWHIWLWRS